MAEVTQQQVVDYIKGISVLELSQLVKALEAELGVSAAAAVPMAMPGVAAGGTSFTSFGKATKFAARMPIHRRCRGCERWRGSFSRRCPPQRRLRIFALSRWRPCRSRTRAPMW